MKIKGDYLLDTIGGEKMAVPITVNDGGLAGLIRLNEVELFCGRSFRAEQQRQIL
mgnify:CR=1 FL=1